MNDDDIHDLIIRADYAEFREARLRIEVDRLKAENEQLRDDYKAKLKRLNDDYDAALRRAQHE
jgi:hypothetical protein